MKKNDPNQDTTHTGRLGSVLESLVHLASWMKGWLESLAERMEKHFERFMRRVTGFLLLFVMMSFGCVFFFVGLLLYIAERTGASIGLVFGIGGAFMFLVCALALVLRAK